MQFTKMTLALSVALVLAACSSNDGPLRPTSKSTNSKQIDLSKVTDVEGFLTGNKTNQNSSGNQNNNSSNNNSGSNNSLSIAPLTAKVADIAKNKKGQLINEIGNSYQSEVNNANFTLKVGNTTYHESDTIDLSKHSTKNQVSDASTTQKIEATINGTTYHATEVQNFRAYRQDYSIVGGYKRDTKNSYSNIDGLTGQWDEEDDISMVKGTPTEADKLPTSGVYNYTGAAFTHNEKGGKLSYDVDFTNRWGQGEITGIQSTGKITLAAGDIVEMEHRNGSVDNSEIKGMGIVSRADYEKHQGSGNYVLGFFGPNAEEVAGVVSTSSIFTGTNTTGIDDVGFGGKRGDTAK